MIYINKIQYKKITYYMALYRELQLLKEELKKVYHNNQ